MLDVISEHKDVFERLILNEDIFLHYSSSSFVDSHIFVCSHLNNSSRELSGLNLATEFIKCSLFLSLNITKH